jgi:hypothetical protein
LHRHDFPCQRHPHGRAPEHRAIADGLAESASIIYQSGVCRQLDQPDDKTENYEAQKQLIAPPPDEAQQNDIIDNV